MLKEISLRALQRARKSPLWDAFVRDLAQQLVAFWRIKQVTSGFDGSPVPDTIAYVAFVGGSAIGAVFYDAHVSTERWLFADPATTSPPKKNITLKPAKVMTTRAPDLPESRGCALLMDDSGTAVGIIFRGGQRDEVRAGLLAGVDPGSIRAIEAAKVLAFKSEALSSVSKEKTIPGHHHLWKVSSTACSDNGLDSHDSHITYMSLGSQDELYHWRSRQSIQPLLPHKTIVLTYLKPGTGPNVETFWRQKSSPVT